VGDRSPTVYPLAGTDVFIYLESLEFSFPKRLYKSTLKNSPGRQPPTERIALVGTTAAPGEVMTDLHDLPVRDRWARQYFASWVTCLPHRLNGGLRKLITALPTKRRCHPLTDDDVQFGRSNRSIAGRSWKIPPHHDRDVRLSLQG
jgi:hypothetical protein